MNVHPSMMVTTNHLRASYDRGEFSFGNPDAPTTVCIVGSCRIVPILNCLRAYNSMNGDPFELICLNPVELWDGPGSDVAECSTRKLKDYRFGKTDFLICESLKRCGALNTLGDEQENVFDSLGCDPGRVLRLPNWHFMHMYHSETRVYNPAYAAKPREEQVAYIRDRAAGCKEKFLSECRTSSFPELVPWVEGVWLEQRLGWTSEHVSRNLFWKFFELISGAMQIPISREFAAHPFNTSDPYASTGAVLTDIDYEANNWKFR